MSLTSKSRKESTESHAAQQMRNTMGVHPELAQLNDKNLDNELPSRVADESNVDPEDVQPIDDETTMADDSAMYSAHHRKTDDIDTRLDSAPMGDDASFDRRATDRQRNPDGSSAELGHS